MSTSDTTPLFNGRDGAILERSWANQRSGFEPRPLVSQGRQWGPEEGWVGRCGSSSCAVRSPDAGPWSGSS